MEQLLLPTLLSLPDSTRTAAPCAWKHTAFCAAQSQWSRHGQLQVVKEERPLL
jgi:hypothetical protein